ELKGEKEALSLAQKTLTFLFLVLSGLTVAGIVFSPQIVSLFAYGFTDQKIIDLTVSLNRIMFPYLFLVGLVAFAMGVLNSHRYFFAPAFSPALLNVGFLLGALLFSRFFEQPLYGLAIGVIFGGVMQLLLQVPYLVKSGFRAKIDLDLKHPGIRKIFRMLGPALFGIAIYQINILINTMLASMLPEGSISYLYYSDRLNEIVLGIFVMSIGSVVLPEMSSCAANGDMGKLKRIYLDSVRAGLFMAIPAAAALMTAGLPIVSGIFLHGNFTSYAAQMTAKALFYASMGIVSLSVLRMTTPAFYSMKDTKTPVITSTIAFVINISLGYVLMHTSLKHAGLALSNTVAVTVQAILLVYFLSRKTGKLGRVDFLGWLAKVVFASAAMIGVLLLIQRNVDWLQGSMKTRILYLSAEVCAGGLTYLTMCWLLNVKEIRIPVQMGKKLTSKLRGGKK
ncbi:MAG: murein biosynthesis integral membrane protein MurJ, partial [Spirochaetota bacterium]